jgi:signal peptidase
MNSNKAESVKTRSAKKKYIVSSVILGAAVLIALYVTICTLAFGYTSVFGYSVFRVVTPSMEPTIPVNSLLICKSVDIKTVAAGDIISFKSKEADHYGAIVTHRVVNVLNGADGEIRLESRGDANYTSDSYYVTEKNFIGKVISYSGKEGAVTKLITFISGKFGFVALIVLPLLIISALVLQSIGRSMKNEMNSALAELKEAERRKNKKQNSKEPGKKEILPGYKTLTKDNYDELRKQIEEEIMKEKTESEEGSESKTEYSDEDQA